MGLFFGGGETPMTVTQKMKSATIFATVVLVCACLYFLFTGDKVKHLDFAKLLVQAAIATAILSNAFQE